MKRNKALIICNENSCRSQMAEGLVNEFLGDEWEAYSAGVNPSKVNPWAIRTMAEIGIDISNARSKSVDEFIHRDDLDLVITVCDNAKDTCPLFAKPVEKVHIGFEDPAEYKNEPEETALPKFRQLREKIKTELVKYLENL